MKCPACNKNTTRLAEKGELTIGSAGNSKTLYCLNPDCGKMSVVGN